MAWRAARSLTTLHAQLKAGSRAAPPATAADAWGLIGDAAHDPDSDHTPHDFPGWGSQIVTAADFPNAPALGLDAHKVLDDIRRARDPRAKYGISNGEIFSNHAVDGYAAWTWRPYNPKNGDRHFTHGHLSVVGDARADGTQPWPTIGGDMASAAEINASRNGFAVAQMQTSYKVISGDIDGGAEVMVGNPLAAALKQLQQDVAAVKATVGAPAPVALDAAAEERIAARAAELVVQHLGGLRFVAAEGT